MYLLLNIKVDFPCSVQTPKRSAAEIDDASAAVLTKGLLNFKPPG